MKLFQFLVLIFLLFQLNFEVTLGNPDSSVQTAMTIPSP